MNKIGALWRALQAGEKLSNSATWKNRQTAINALLAVLGCIALFLPIEVSHEDLQLIAGGIGAVGGLFNAWATTSTSRTVGLPARSEPADDTSDGMA